MKKFILTLLIAFIGPAALAQPGPTPSPLIQSGQSIIPVNPSSCLTMPQAVTGGCKGAGSANFQSLFINGVAVGTVGGSVSSVGLSLPGAVFTISNSPVTTSGTLTGTFATQTANRVWAGPTTGSAAAPTFRSLVSADLPLPTTSLVGGVRAIVAISGQWINSINTSGIPQLSQPTFNDISGSLTLSQFPAIGAGTLLGNATGGSDLPTALSAAQATSLLNAFTTSLKGLVPASGGGTTTFLRADGSFSPVAVGSVTGVLPTANGGTALSTFTAANNAIYSTSASVLTAGTLPVLAGGTGATTSTGSGSTVLSSGAAMAALTVTGSFTATGLVTNADITNAFVQVVGGTSTGLSSPGSIALGAIGTIMSINDDLRFHGLGLGLAAPTGGGQISTILGANNLTGIQVKRFTDTSPTGNFINLQNAAAASVFTLDITGAVTVGTWSGTVIGSTKGGAGSVSGILKANGSGTVSAAVSATDYAPATSGSSILLGSSGGFASYAGTSCTNQFPRALSGAGVGTCASVANADLVNASFTLNAGSNFGITVPGTTTLGTTVVIGNTGDNLRFNGLGLGVAAPTTAGQIAATLGANNVNGIIVKRFTDTTPGGSFMIFQNAAGSSVFGVDITGTINTATWGGAVIGSTFGGAGAVSGILKANGAGVVSAAASGTDYAPATSGSTLLLGNGAGGFSAYAGSSPSACSNQFLRNQTLSSTGAGTNTCATVANADLANSSITLNVGASVGLTAPGAMALGSTVTIGSTSDKVQLGALGLNVATPSNAGQISTTLAANNIIGIQVKRFTDSSPTGSFEVFQNAAGSTVWAVGIDGSVNSGQWKATVVAAQYGGTGANLSATGGASQVLKQVGIGSAITVGQLACSDLSGVASSCSTDATNASNISSGTLPSGRLTGSYTGITGVGTLTAGATSTGFTVNLATSTVSGQLPLANAPAAVNYPQSSGAVCTGSGNDRAALAAADAVSGTSQISITGTCTVTTTNLSISKQLVFLSGGMIQPATGITVTLSKVPVAPANQKIFANATAGQGSVVLQSLAQSGNPEVYPEWWGGVADRSTDSSPAAQAAHNFLTNGGTIKFGPGYYKMACASADALTITTDSVNVRGSGSQTTWLVPATNCAHFVIKMSPANLSGDIRDLAFYGADINGTGVTYSNMQWGAIWCAHCSNSLLSDLQGYGFGTFLLGDIFISMVVSNVEAQGGGGTGWVAGGASGAHGVAAIPGVSGQGACIQLGGSATSGDWSGPQNVSINDFSNVKCFGLIEAPSFTGTISGTTLTVSAVLGTIEAGQYVSGSGVTEGTRIVSGSGPTWTVSTSQTIGPVPMASAAGIALVLDTGANETSFRRFVQGANYGGALIQNYYASTAGHRPEALRFYDGSNFSGNVAYGMDVESAWTVEFNGSSLNGTYIGPGLYFGSAGNSYTASISGTTMTVPGSVTGAPLAAGQSVNCATCLQGTYIVSGSGTSWVVSASQTVLSSLFNNVAADAFLAVGSEVVGTYLNDNIIMRAACNLAFRSGKTYGAGASVNNINSAVRVTSYACGNVDVQGAMMGDIAYGNFHNTQAYAMVLESGSLATKYVASLSRVGRLNVQINTMAGNQTGAINDLGTSPSGFSKLIANNILQ